MLVCDPTYALQLVATTALLAVGCCGVDTGSLLDAMSMLVQSTVTQACLLFIACFIASSP